MNALIFFDSRYGNTEQVARSMAEALRSAVSVRLEKVDQASTLDAQGIDLLIVGGPTHRHKASATLQAILESAPRQGLKGVKAAAFDTRYRMAAWLSGSAAKRIARQLRKLGARVIAPPESFFMERDVPPKGQKRRHELERLEAGELKRAAEWAIKIMKAAEET